jgi:hypothetical protein
MRIPHEMPKRISRRVPGAASRRRSLRCDALMAWCAAGVIVIAIIAVNGPGAALFLSDARALKQKGRLRGAAPLVFDAADESSRDRDGLAGPLISSKAEPREAEEQDDPCRGLRHRRCWR